MRALPPMNALRCFDSAARHLNFSAAADELRVSHSAVSQQIRRLESWLGCKLFERRSDGVRLTAAGQDMLRACQPAFDLIEQRCIALRDRGRSAELVVGAPASLLSSWLIPRLERFEREHPALRVRLQTAADVSLLERRTVDALIVAQTDPPAGLAVTPLFPEAIGPVCAPARARRIETPADVLKEPLLSTSSRITAWEQWAAVHGLDLGQARSTMRQFDQLSHMLEAAAAGLGIGIAPEMLVREDVRNGRLGAPLGFEATGACFSLFTRADAGAAVDSLGAWLRSEAEAGGGTR
ncbi:MAG: LysR substrate-binding domain-containing protein [Burkholderiaceae bacterium]